MMSRVLVARPAPGRWALLAGVLGIVFAALAAAPPLAARDVPFVAGEQPIFRNPDAVIHAAKADVDGDGDLDLFLTIAPSQGSSVLCWMRNVDGTGTEWEAVLIDTNFFFGELAVGDFDRDGTADVVVVHGSKGNHLRTYRNLDGDGTNWPEGGEFAMFGDFAPVVGDFNNDGWDDIAAVVLGFENSEVQVGIFEPFNAIYQPFTALAGAPFFQELPFTLEVGDWNHDGLDDLFFAGRLAGQPEGGRGIGLLQNDDAGMSWSVRDILDLRPFDIDTQVMGIVVTDATRNGRLDVVYAIASAGSVEPGMFLGTFRDPKTGWQHDRLASSSFVTRIGGAADFDHNGTPDVVLAGDDAITLWSNAGDGTFERGGSPVFFDVDATRVLGFFDKNANGHADVLFAGAGLVAGPVDRGQTLDGIVGYAANRDVHRTHGFQHEEEVFFDGTTMEDFVLVDFDHDGTLDLLFIDETDPEDPRISFARGFGHGGFAVPMPLVSADVRQFLVVDVNHDGALDLVWHDREMVVWAHNLSPFEPSFGEPIVVDVPFGEIRDMALVDWNGDNYPDLVLFDRDQGDYFILLNVGSVRQIGFEDFAQPLFMGDHGVTPGEGMAAATFTQRRELEFVGTDPDAGRIYWVRDPNLLLGEIGGNLGGGRGSVSQVFPISNAAPGVEQVAVVDVDRDGRPDVVAALEQDVVWYRNEGPAAGQFDPTPRRVSDATLNAPMFVLVDVDLDGDVDVLVAEEGGNTVHVALNDGKGTFTVAPHRFDALGGTFAQIAAADVDRDGSPDLMMLFGPPLSRAALARNALGQFGITADTPLAPETMSDDQAAALRSFEIAHLGRAGDDAVYFSQLGVALTRFEANPPARGVTGFRVPMNAFEMTSVFAELSVWRDTGDGTWSDADDERVGSLGAFDGEVGGIVGIEIDAFGTAVTPFGEPGPTYFLVATLAPEASSSGIVDFEARLVGTPFTRGLNADHETELVGAFYDGPPSTPIVITGGLPTISFELSSTTSNEGDAEPTFVTLLVEPAIEDTYSVTFQFIAGSATPGADFTITPTTSPLTFTGTSFSFEVDPVDDLMYEGPTPENFAIQILDVTTGNAAIGAINRHTHSIEDNDFPPSMEFAAPPTFDEAVGTVTLRVELTNPTFEQVTFDLVVLGSSTATDGDDYTLGATNGSIAPGGTFFEFDVAIVDDLLYEGDETIDIQFTNLAGAGSGDGNTANLLIVDNDDPPTIAFLGSGAFSVAEDDGSGIGTMTLEVTGQTALPIEVALAILPASTATENVDYAAPPLAFTISPGTPSVDLSFAITDDNLFEGPETIVVEIESASNATIGASNPGTLTIVDDEPQPSVAFALSEDSLIESGTNGEGAFEVEVVLSGPVQGVVTVDFTATDGTALGGGVDYALFDTQVSFGSGETIARIAGEFNDDLLDEDDETFSLELTGATLVTIGSPSTFTMTILDDDPLPRVGFRDFFTDVLEGDGTVSIPIVLSEASGRDVTVEIAVTGGSATGGGVDYDIAATTVAIPAGEVEGFLAIDIVDDDVFEFFESINLEVTDPVHANVDQEGAFTTVFIEDNDPEPTATFLLAEDSVVENAGTYVGTVVLSATHEAFFEFFLQDDLTGTAAAGTDYHFSDDFLSFAEGETVKSFAVTIVDDSDPEPIETVDFALFRSFGKGRGDGPVDTMTLSILDDDLAVSWDDGFLFVGEGSGVVPFGVTLNAPAPRDVVLEIETYVYGPFLSLDFALLAGNRLVIPEGQTQGAFEIEFFDDDLPEDGEYFYNFIAAAHYEASPGELVGVSVTQSFLDLVIEDNDAPIGADGRTFRTDEPSDLRAFTRVLGDDADDLLGGRAQGVAMGDLNDDGFDDLIIGAYGADKPGNLWSVGEVYVVWGSESMPSIGTIDLNTNGAERPGVVRILGDQTLDEFGYSVTTGDLNHDGIADLIVGAWRKPFAGDTFGGRVYVFYGGRDWPRSGVLDVASAEFDADLEIRAGIRGGALGASLAVGDFDGDGGTDLAIGAPDASLLGRGERVGRTYVVWGNSATRTEPLGPVVNLAQPPVVVGTARGGEPLFSYLELVGPFAEGKFGASLASGRLNYDPIDDLVSGLPGMIDTSKGVVPGGVALVAGFPGLGSSPQLDLLDDLEPDLYSSIHLNWEMPEFLFGDRVTVGALGVWVQDVSVGWTARRLEGTDPSFVRFGFLFLPSPFDGKQRNREAGRGKSGGEFDIWNDDPAAARFGTSLLMASTNGTARPQIVLSATDNTYDPDPSQGGRMWALDSYLFLPLNGGGDNRGSQSGRFVDEMSAWVVASGGSENEFLGSALAGGADLNGDGFNDLIVSARGFDHPDVAPLLGQATGNDTGGAFIVWGRAPVGGVVTRPVAGRGGQPQRPTAYGEFMAGLFDASPFDFGREVRARGWIDAPSTSIFGDGNEFALEFAPQATFATGDESFALPGVWTWGYRFADVVLPAFTVTYLPRDIVGFDPATVTLYQVTDDGSWAPLPSVVDVANRTVTWDGTGAQPFGPRVQFGLAARERTTGETGLVVR